MPDKILFVDDERAVLDGYKRMLGRGFEVDTAVGGEQGLTTINELGPYAIVISDMRMPIMNGAQFLARVRQTAPDTVRMLLTGHTDMNSAIEAVNEGNIFRFLTKPCEKDILAKALTTGLVQYRLVTAEKELLELTLSGSIQVLTEVLSLVNPAAFSRAERARRYIHHVVTSMNLGNPWQYEVAAMMSQLGCVTLPPETIDAVYRGEKLSTTEQTQYDSHPHVAYELLSKIPRLEAIAWMIDHQNQVLPEAGPDDPQPADIRRGAEILRLIIAYENLIHKGASRTEAAHTLSRQNKGLKPELLQALVTLDPNAEEGVVKKCRVQDLSIGMIVQQEIRTSDGTLLVSKGQEVTSPLLLKLKNFHARRTIGGEVTVSMPTTTLAFVKGAS